MKRFARLCEALATHLFPAAQEHALGQYLREAPREDAAWAVYLLAGGRQRAVLAVAALRGPACERAGLTDWLFEACQQASGDLAETLALVWPDDPAAAPSPGLDACMREWLLPLAGLAPPLAALRLATGLGALDARARLLLLRLAGGRFRPGVRRLQVQRVLAAHTGLDLTVAGQRLTRYTEAFPDAARFDDLCRAPEANATDPGQPHAFAPLQPLVDPGALETAWRAEWACGGTRVQLVRRAGQAWVWTPEGECLNPTLGRALALFRTWPDGAVIEGVLRGQERPVLVAFDLLECDGVDLRPRPGWQRRAALEAHAPRCPGLQLAQYLPVGGAAALDIGRRDSRRCGMNGLVFKDREAAYGERRWLRWTPEPLCVRAVLIHAHADASEYTLAVWSRPPTGAEEVAAVVEAIALQQAPPAGALQLVPVARTGAGLDDAQARELRAVVSDTTLARHGPVRSVRPTRVFELAFDGVQRSRRHKSGLVLQAPRVQRVLPAGEPLHPIGTLDELRAWLPVPP